MSSVVHIGQDLATTFYTGQVLVGTTIVQVVAQPIDIMKGVQLKAASSNAGTIYIGRDTVSSTTGFPLLAGESVFISVEDVTKIKAIASEASQGLSWLAL